MSSIKYTKAVGQKFHADGSLRRFPGSSIICPLVPGSQIYDRTLRFQDELRHLPFSHKYALLPPSSFHMTAIDLVCDQVREAKRWTAHLPTDTALPVVDQYFVDQMSQVAFPATLHMRFTGLNPNGVSLDLEPATTDTAQMLRSFRDTVTQVTGVRHPNHATYGFHVSVAYQIIALTVEEEARLEAFLEQACPDLAASLGHIPLERPQLVFFDDMARFLPAEERHRLASRRA